MEEYHPKVVHTAGKLNLSADSLSRLSMNQKSQIDAECEVQNAMLRYLDGGQKENIVFNNDTRNIGISLQT